MLVPSFFSPDLSLMPVSTLVDSIFTRRAEDLESFPFNYVEIPHKVKAILCNSRSTRSLNWKQLCVPPKRKHPSLS